MGLIARGIREDGMQESGIEEGDRDVGSEKILLQEEYSNLLRS
jgi:hypothetical protein